MNNITKFEWCILDELSDDYECFASIYPNLLKDLPDTSSQDVQRGLYQLYKSGLIELMEGRLMQEEDLMSETEKSFDTKYWFGLTSTGCDAWESGAAPPVDWSEAYTAHIDYKKQNGYIEGTTRKVCLRELNQLPIDKTFQIDMKSLSHSEIPGFQAKYYKYISGGHRIDFKLKRARTQS